MREIAKRLVPTALLRRIRALRVSRNRHSIATASRTHGTIVLTPDVVVEHFYHFIFDLTLPLFLALEAAPATTTFIVNTTGPFLPRLKLLFPGRVTIAEGRLDPNASPRRLLLG